MTPLLYATRSGPHDPETAGAGAGVGLVAASAAIAPAVKPLSPTTAATSARAAKRDDLGTATVLGVGSYRYAYRFTLTS